MHDALKLDGVCKKFHKFTLGPLDFQLELGMSVALVGENGSGKSTLLRLIMQLLYADQGKIEVFGRNIAQDEVDIKKRIGYMSDHLLQPFGSLRIDELAEYYSYSYPSWNSKRYEYLIDRYDIPVKEKLSRCSTGMQKKAAFIFTLSHEPQLLLLDEPTTSVDLAGQRKMLNDLSEYMDDGQKSIVMATHVIEDVKRLCDVICVLHRGRILGSFDKDEMRNRWGRIWVKDLPSHLQRLPHIVAIENSPLHIVTDHMDKLEQQLIAEGIEIEHRQRLELSEAISYLID